MTHEYSQGQYLLWPETDDDRAAILKILGPPEDTLRACSAGDAARVYGELLRMLRARPPPYTKASRQKPGA